jgi:PAS domain S-box-containing protein
MLGAAAIGAFQTDLSGQIVDVNRAFCEMTGYARHELIQRPHAAFVHPDFKSPPADFSRLVNGEIDHYEREKQYVRKDGTPLWTVVSVSLLRNQHGLPRHTLNVLRDITEQRRAEERLKESEQRYRESFENAAVGITHVGLDRRVIAVNRKFCEITGYTRDDLVGTDIFSITPEQARTFHPQTEALYRGDIPHIEVEKIYLHRDGHPIWVNSTITVQRDRHGNPLYRISIIEDITERKRAEVRLSAEHAISRIIGTAPTMDHAAPRVLKALCDAYDLAAGELWDSDDDGQTFRCSSVHASEELGDGAATWREAALSTVVDDKASLQSKAWRSKRPAWRVNARAGSVSPRKHLFVSMGVVSQMVFPLMAGHRCSGVVFLHARRKLVEDSELEESLSSLGRDLGQFRLRTHTEQALRESETLLRAAARATNDAIWDWDLKAGRVRWNESLKELFGYDIDDERTPEGWWQEKVHPDDREPVLASMCTAAEAGQERWNGEYRLRTAGGSYAYVLDRGHIIRDADGAVIRMIGAIQDVTQRRQLEESLRQSKATLERRVQERTAELEALTESLRLLAAKLSQAEQRERRRLAELIHDELQQLLVAARMQTNAARASGRPEAFGVPLDMAISLLDQAIEEARSLTAQLRPPALYESGLAASLGWLAGWMKKAHGFDVKLKADTSTLDLPEPDAVMLFDSVRELLLNAVKYSGTKTATVSVDAADEEWLLLSVSDRGAGFEVSALRQPRSGGFGLFGVRERITALGGRFEMRSAPGEGTEIKLFWPRTKPADAPPGEFKAAKPEARPAPNFPLPRQEDGQIAVLLVDDHALVRQSLAALLGRQPSIVVTAQASDGEQAVEAAEMYRPQVVVMDVNLPRLNGIQATRLIKEQHPDVVVIGVSIHNDAGTRQAMLDAGASAYLSKDGPVETLLETIHSQALLARARCGAGGLPEASAFRSSS